MRKIGFLIVALVLTMIACGFLGREESEEVPAGELPTEVAEMIKPSEEAEPPLTTEPSTTTEVPIIPGKEVPIEPKPKTAEAEPIPAVTAMPVSSGEEGLPEDREEIY